MESNPRGSAQGSAGRLQGSAGNISTLEEHDILSEAPARALHEVAGLRNRLVHEYNGLDDEIAIDSARRLAPDLRKACEEVRSWLSTNG